MKSILENKSWIVSKIVLFYFLAVYVGQRWFTRFIVWPCIHWTSNHYPAWQPVISEFTHLDYGRTVGRISSFFAGLLMGYAYIWTRNLYFCIGIHYAWNTIESVVFSKSMVIVTVNNALLAGNKDITPNEEGLISLPILIVALLVLYIWQRSTQTKPVK